MNGLSGTLILFVIAVKIVTNIIRNCSFYIKKTLNIIDGVSGDRYVNIN